MPKKNYNDRCVVVQLGGIYEGMVVNGKYDQFSDKLSGNADCLSNAEAFSSLSKSTACSGGNGQDHFACTHWHRNLILWSNSTLSSREPCIYSAS